MPVVLDVCPSLQWLALQPAYLSASAGHCASDVRMLSLRTVDFFGSMRPCIYAVTATRVAGISCVMLQLHIDVERVTETIVWHTKPSRIPVGSFPSLVLTRHFSSQRTRARRCGPLLQLEDGSFHVRLRTSEEMRAFGKPHDKQYTWLVHICHPASRFCVH